MRYDNVISLCATIGSEQKDLSDLTREQVIAAFTSRINDLFDHDEFHAVYDLADQVETEQERGYHYVVNLKDRNDPYAEWFQSDIEGTYDHCHSQVRLLLLNALFQIQIVEG